MLSITREEEEKQERERETERGSRSRSSPRNPFLSFSRSFSTAKERKKERKKERVRVLRPRGRIQRIRSFVRYLKKVEVQIV